MLSRGHSPLPLSRSPLSASKRWSLEVSAHSWAVSPRLILLAGSRRATTAPGPRAPRARRSPPAVPRPVRRVDRTRPRRLDVEVGVEVGAERLDQIDLGLEDDAALVAQVADHLGVLEALRAQAGDHLAVATVAQALGQSASPIGSFTLAPLSSAGMKFIAGEPMKPATKMLAGSRTARPGCRPAAGRRPASPRPGRRASSPRSGRG